MENMCIIYFHFSTLIIILIWRSFVIFPTFWGSSRLLLRKSMVKMQQMLETKESLLQTFRRIKKGLELLKIAIEKAGYAGKVVIGMDVAASEFYTEKDQKYDLNFKEENNDGSEKISESELIKIYESFIEFYPIVSIEDPFDQDDWAHYAQFTATVGEKVQIVGDDLLVTNPKRVGKAINETSCNALLLKVNQIGSATESIEAVKMSKRAGWGVMTSHLAKPTTPLLHIWQWAWPPAKSRQVLIVVPSDWPNIIRNWGRQQCMQTQGFRKPVEPY